MHENLKKQANKKGLTGKRRLAYIFGTMARLRKEGKIK